MVKRLWPVLIALLACGLIAAGCGDDDDDSSAAPAATEESTDAAEEITDAAESGDVDAAIQAAVDACKQSIQATPGLSADTISELEGLCDEAASGDIEDAQAASVEVCEAIVEDTVPEGTARDTALSACASALRRNRTEPIRIGGLAASAGPPTAFYSHLGSGRDECPRPGYLDVGADRRPRGRRRPRRTRRRPG